MAQGMTKAVCNYTRRLKDMAGEELLRSALKATSHFAVQVAMAGGRMVDRQPLPKRKA